MPQTSRKNLRVPRAPLRCLCRAPARSPGARERESRSWSSSELFSLSMGKMEDQVDLFQFENAMVARANSVTMRDGWFYIANGERGQDHGLLLVRRPDLPPVQPADKSRTHHPRAGGPARRRQPSRRVARSRGRGAARHGEHARVRRLSLRRHRADRRGQRPHAVRGGRGPRGQSGQGHGPRRHPQPRDPPVRPQGPPARLAR